MEGEPKRVVRATESNPRLHVRALRVRVVHRAPRAAAAAAAAGSLNLALGSVRGGGGGGGGSGSGGRVSRGGAARPHHALSFAF